MMCECSQFVWNMYKALNRPFSGGLSKLASRRSGQLWYKYTPNEDSEEEEKDVYAIIIYNSVSLFVCLFIRNSGRNYWTGRHQTLRDYNVGRQKCPPGVEIARLAVLEVIFFNFRFSFVTDCHFINYRSLDFRISDGLIRCRPQLNLSWAIIIAATLCC